MKTEMKIYDFGRNMKKWSSLLERGDEFSLFHTSEWLNFLEKAYRVKIILLIGLQKNKTMIALPLGIRNALGLKIFSSLPFSDDGGPIADGKEDLYALPHFLSKFADELFCDLIHIRTTNEKTASCFENSGYNDYSDLCTFCLDVSKGPEFIWNEIFTKKSKQRWKIRKAQQRGVIIGEVDWEDVQGEFYTMFLETMHRRGGLPIEMSVFATFFEQVSSAKLFAAKLNNRNVSFLTLATFGENAYLLHNVSRLEKEYQGLYHNIAIYWHAIKWASLNSIRKLYFGATPQSPQDGLYLFKSKLGGIPKHLYDLYKANTFRGKLFLFLIQRNKPMFSRLNRYLKISGIARDKLPF